MKLKAIASSFLLGVLPTISAAQTVIGSSVIDGRQIEILSDKSWRFKEQSSSSCRRISVDVEFCGERSGWTFVREADGTTQFQYSGLNYGEFIVEPIGKKQGLTTELMRTVIISNAATAAKVTPKDIPVLSVTTSKVGSSDAETMVYSVDISGLKTMFYNTYVIDESNTYQIVTYSINAVADKETLDIHDRFLKATTKK